MKIRSINDVITNSSDETFVIKTTESPKVVLQKLREELDRHPEVRYQFSGMGGILETASRENYENFEYADYFCNLIWLPDDHIIVTIDYGWIGQLVDFLEKNYEIVQDYENTLVKPFLKTKIDIALKSLEMMTKQEDIEKAYSELEYWEGKLLEYE